VATADVPQPLLYGGAGGRHRRHDARVVVHLVLVDGVEVALDRELPVVRSIAHLAALLTERRVSAIEKDEQRPSRSAHGFSRPGRERGAEVPDVWSIRSTALLAER
jgi:hypothetical protein